MLKPDFCVPNYVSSREFATTRLPGFDEANWTLPGYTPNQLRELTATTFDDTSGEWQYAAPTYGSSKDWYPPRSLALENPGQYLCTDESPYYNQTCQDCPRTTFDASSGECLSNTEVWFALARSIGIGLVSTSSSIALLPEFVRMQWRISFMFYVLCQILFRVLAMTMAATVASLTGNLPLFGGFFAGTFLIQVAISSPRRAAEVAEAMKARNVKALRKEVYAQKKLARTKILTDYTVIIGQPLQQGPNLDSAFVRHVVKHVSRVKKVKPGDVIKTVETEWLPNGKQRVRLNAGWLSVQNSRGEIMLAPRAKTATDTDAANVGFIEKFWIGMLTIIVPVSFDTIKNLHKSNPAQEGPVSFFIRVWINALMTMPFVFFWLERQQMDDDPDYTPYTYKEENLDKNWEAYSQDPNLIWMERISTS